MLKLVASGKGKKCTAVDEGLDHLALSKKGKGSLLKPAPTPKMVTKVSKKHKVIVEHTNNDDNNGDNDDDKENKLVDLSHAGHDKGTKNYTMWEL